jgi:hypothetical protein
MVQGLGDCCQYELSLNKTPYLERKEMKVALTVKTWYSNRWEHSQPRS